MILERDMRWPLRLVVLHGLVITWAVSASIADDGGGYSKLGDAGRSESENYVAQRNALLSKADGLWDVVEAAKVDWRTGLAAFVCNARLVYPALFTHADALPAHMNAVGTWKKNYDHMLIREPSAFAPLLVETVWKTAEHPDIRQEAVRRLVFDVGSGYPIGGAAELWKAVWEGAEDDGLKHIAIHALAQKESAVAEGVVTKVLTDNKENDSIRLALLNGMGTGRPQYAYGLLKSVMMDLADNRKLVGRVFYNYYTLGGRKERSVFVDFIADAATPFPLRLFSVELCAGEAEEGDIAAILIAMEDRRHPELQLAAIKQSNKYPFAAMRAGLRSLIAADTNNDVVVAAAGRLVMCGDERDREFVREFREREGTRETLTADIERQFEVWASRESRLDRIRKRTIEEGGDLAATERTIEKRRRCEPDQESVEDDE